MKKKSIQRIILLLIITIITCFNINVKAENYETVSNFSNSITTGSPNYVWTSWNSPNGYTYMPYKSTSDGTPTFCTRFSYEEPPANVQCFIDENSWSEPIKAGVAAIIKKANVASNSSSSNLPYYYAEIAINRFLYEYGGWNSYNRVYFGLTTRQLLKDNNYYVYFTEAQKAYNIAKQNVTIKLSTNNEDTHILDSSATGTQTIEQNYKINGNADSYKVKYNLTGTSNANNYSIKINGQTVNNNTYVNLSNKEFNVTVTFDADNLRADKNVRVDVTVEGTTGYDIAVNYNCSGYQSLTPNKVKATSKSANATDSFTMTIPNQKRPKLVIRKCEDTGCTKPINKDVTFSLLKVKDEKETVIQTFRATNGTRTINNLSDNLSEEKYCVREVHAPDGYELSGTDYCFIVKTENGEVNITNLSNQYINVDNNSDPKVITLTFRDNPTIIKVAKVNENNQKMAGFGLQLEDKDGNIVSSEGVTTYWGNTTSDPLTLSNNQLKWESRDDKTLFIYGLPHGTYYLRETSAPTESEYVLNPDRVEITITETDVTVDGDDDTNVIRMVNNKTSINIKKVDKNNHELTGTNLQILDENKNVVSINGTPLSWTSGQNGEKQHTITGLKPGKYYIHETSATSGYKVCDDIEFTINEYGYLNVVGQVTKNSTISVENDKTSFKVSKKDVANNKNLAGARLQILDNKGKVVKVIVTNDNKVTPNENGQVYWETKSDADFTIEGLPAGTYRIHEIKAPDGYILSDEDIVFTVNKDGTIIVNGKKSTNSIVTVTNKKNELYISKKDITGEDELEGATLVITNLDTKKEVAKWVSGKTPKHIEALKPGNYQLKEIQAPNGYVLSTETINFTVSENGKILFNEEEKDSTTLIMTNENTKVYISKQDITTKEELPGAHLVVKDEEGNIVKDGEWDSTTEPHLIEGLGEGTYTITEITAPDGYTKSEETITFTIDANGAVSGNTVMYNTPIPDVPSTLSTQSIIITIVGIVLVGTGIGLYIYGIKKKKEI